MLINYFLILTTLLLIGGLVLDGGILEWRNIHLQAAADAAAQEAAYQFGRSDTAWVAEGAAQASANGFTTGTNGATVTITYPPSGTPWVGDQWSVQATVSQSVNNTFMSLINAGKSTVKATAVARVLPTCVWIMNPSSPSSPSFWLASANLWGPCGLYVNTATGANLLIDGFASLYNLRTRVVGLSSGNSSSGTIDPQPRFGSSVKHDPLAYITAPTFSACTPGDSNVSFNGGTHTLNYGTYCGGITLTNTTVTLNSGLYIITGGLTMNNSYLYATSGVTLYFTQGGGSGFGSVYIAGTYGTNTSAVYIKAPTTTANGGIPGIAVFADRTWIAHGSHNISLLFTQVTTDGVWYAPNIGFYSWISPMNYYTYNGLVVDNYYQFGSTCVFHPDYTNLGGSGPFGGTSPYHYEDGALVY